jgi:5'-3' exonuclease
MGVLLTPIVVKDAIDLADLRGRRLAVDANGELYQFLALIRLPDGTPLKDSQGRITSHLSGLFCRTTRLVAEFALPSALTSIDSGRFSSRRKCAMTTSWSRAAAMSRES